VHGPVRPVRETPPVDTRLGPQGLTPPPGSVDALPSRTDPLVRGLSRVLGGPVGRRAALSPAPRRAAALVLLPLAAGGVWLGWLLKAPCLDVSRWIASYQYTRFCYTDVLALWGAERLDAGAVPYVDHPVEYPVGIGALMHLGRLVVDALEVGEAAQPGVFLTVTSVLLSAAAAVVTWTTLHLAGPGREWDAGLVAAAPLLVTVGVVNWDLVAVALAGLGLLAWARGRPVLAGVLLGLGGVTKLYPLLLLLPLLLVSLRAAHVAPWWRAAVAAGGTVAVVVVPAYALAGTFDGRNAVLRFVDLNRDRPADWDSLWWAAQQVRGGEPFAQHVLTLGVAASLLAALAAVCVLAWRAPEPPRVAQLAFLVVTAFLLTNKVFSPQFALWLLPLAALARPSWRLLLAWQAAELAVLVTRNLYFANLGDTGTGLGADTFVAAVLLRDAALLLLAAVVVRDVLRPQHDPVRTGGRGDPAAGPALARAG
jgi:uncharacterized membrane protein